MAPKLRPSYRHDGTIGVEGFLIVFGFGLVGSILLGIGHGILPFHLPEGWSSATGASLAATVILLGAIVGAAARLGRVRTDLFAAAMALLFAVVSWYAAWAAHLTTFLRLSATPDDPTLAAAVIAPEAVLAGIYRLAVLPVFAGVAEAGTETMTLLLWLGEAVAFLVVPPVVAWRWSRHLPFCDRTGTWCTERETIAPFVPAPDAAALREALEQGRLDALLELGAQEPSSPLYTQAIVRHARGERGSHFLTVWTVEPPPNWPGGRPPADPTRANEEAAGEGGREAASQAGDGDASTSEEFFDRFVPVKNQRPILVVRNLVLTRQEFERLLARRDALKVEAADLEARRRNLAAG